MCNFSMFYILFARTHCRSTPAKHAANPYHREKHPDAQEKLKHYINSTQFSLKLYHVFFTVVHIYGYVYNMYP